jgi:hypothetical protein
MSIAQHLPLYSHTKLRIFHLRGVQAVVYHQRGWAKPRGSRSVGVF